jgi:methyl-accepting chemotaxis protein
MKWFVDLKISSKLFLAFCLITLLALAVGIVSIINLITLKNADTDLYDKNSLALQYSGETTASVLQLQYTVLQYRYATTPAQTEEIKALIADYEKATDENLDKLINKIMETKSASDELIKTAEELQTIWGNYSSNLEAYFQYIDEGSLGKSIEQREILADIGDEMKDKIINCSALVSLSAGEKSASNAVKTSRAINAVIIVLIIVIAASLFLNAYISGLIGQPLVTMTKLANLLSVGDIDTDKVLTNRDMKLKGRKDEIGKLSTAFHKLIVGTKKQVGAAQLVAEGDLTAKVEVRSENDVLGKALSALVDSLNNIIISIVGAAEQLSAGSASLSDSSLALSQGATEQASSVEQLTASLEQISTQTNLNAQNAEMANKLAISAKQNADSGNGRMKEMLKAMDEINVSSNNINKIIKVIDDIAFQTNILALNAAVEAARAGQHGLGFAVVAEEVRTLAAKSASAASETTEMIESSIQKVKTGTMIANETATALANIVEEVEKAAKLVGAIAVASKEQAAAIDQINKGIMQVSQVVQANAATSEESAAASQELSGQAAQLKEIVSAFKLQDGMASDHIEN